MKKIADISHYQGAIDWSKARDDLEMAIFRASVGSNADKRYLEYTESCGIPYGAYHYVKAGTAEAARTEARFFVECANKAKRRPLFYIADIEYSAQTATTTEAVCVAFLEELRKLGCEKIGLYINTRYKWAGKAISLCDIMWIPHWGKNDGSVPAKSYAPKYYCDLWQYTSKGRVNGISGNVDLDMLYGDKPLEWFTQEAENTEETEDNTDENEEAGNMGFDRQKVIDIALAEEGYLEKASNKDLDSKTGNAGKKNYTKYARDMDAIPGFYNGRKQGVAWCDVFVDWCFVQAYGVDDGRALLCQPTKSCGAGCKYSRQYYKAKGRLFESPEPGDQIFFYPADGIGGSAISHTGLVYKVDNSYVYTVEGNTSTASGVVANGGGVAKKKYKLNYNRIAGYGRPNYSAGTTIQPTPTQPEPDKPETGEEPKGKTVVVTASSVNVRVGNGTNFSRITAVSKGTMLEWVATAENGWHAVVYKKQVAWISGKYAEVRG